MGFSSEFGFRLTETGTNPNKGRDLDIGEFNLQTVIGKISDNPLNTAITAVEKSMGTFNEYSSFCFFSHCVP
jgi:hypothetical protein